MAITGSALQTALGDGNLNLPQVIAELPPYGASSQYWVVKGGVTHRGWQAKCVTTASDNAATQATSVVAQLLALTKR